MHLSVARPAGPDDLRHGLSEVLAARSALAVLAPAQDPGAVVPNAPAEPGTLVLATSGSTGAPKAVELSASALRASAEATCERLGETDWVCALPVHHIAGLMTLVRAQISGTAVVAASPRLTDLPRPTRPTAISLVPTQLVRALDQPDLVAVLAAHVAVLVGGAASDPLVVERARGLGIPVTTTYGMTETCGGCVYDGVPLSGVEVELESDGRILLGGPMVFSGYRGDPALTAEVLINGRVRTQDRGRWVAGRLEVLGRLDEVIISGGVNVDLAEVERAVRSLDANSAVVGVPDPEWGVVVTVVSTTTVRDLPWWQGELSSVLARSALPRRLAVVDSLPVTSSGKVDRQSLVAVLQGQQAPEDPGTPNHEETRGNTR